MKCVHKHGGVRTQSGSSSSLKPSLTQMRIRRGSYIFIANKIYCSLQWKHVTIMYYVMCQIPTCCPYLYHGALDLYSYCSCIIKFYIIYYTEHVISPYTGHIFFSQITYKYAYCAGVGGMGQYIDRCITRGSSRSYVREYISIYKLYIIIYSVSINRSGHSTPWPVLPQNQVLTGCDHQ